MKIGIIGGYGHACVGALPGAKLAWACDGYDERALEQVAARSCSLTYPSMDALIEGFQPDIVYIGTVYARNGILAIKALEQGFNVICEKPIAADPDTLQRLCELTASGERQIIAELAMRWNAAFGKARELILSGAVGEPVLIHARKSYRFGASRPEFYRSRALFGGIIPWVATHAIDFAAWSTGLRYEAVAARHGNCAFPDYPEMEDHASLFFRMTGGVPCYIMADFLRPEGAATHGDDRLHVTGTKGVVEVRGEDVFFTDASGERQWNFPCDGRNDARCARDLVNAALGDPCAPISTAESLEVTAVALVARKAADAPQGGAIYIHGTDPLKTSDPFAVHAHP